MNNRVSSDDLLQNARPTNKVCAVLVTFNIGKRVLAGLESLLEQAENIIIVDNNSSDNSFVVAQEFADTHVGKVQVLQSGMNNLAVAQNIGIKAAKHIGAEFILLMDHDSVAGSGMVANLLEAQQNYNANSGKKVAIAAPNLADRFSVRQAHYTCHIGRAIFWRKTFGKNAILDDLMVAIASGSLIPMNVIDEIGLMNENFCIDQVDFEWSLRALTSGYKIIAVRNAMLEHQLGKCRDFKVMSMCVTTSNHNAMRRYYIYRNRLRLWRLYGHKIPSFVLFDLCAILFDLGKITMLGANRRAKFRAILSGVRDAVFGCNIQNTKNTEYIKATPIIATEEAIRFGVS
jgi:rhamnosyltransferase